jgi:hypothetical protein
VHCLPCCAKQYLYISPNSDVGAIKLILGDMPKDTDSVDHTSVRVEIAEGSESTTGISPSCSGNRLKRLAWRTVGTIAALVTMTVLVAVQSVLDVNIQGVDSVLRAVKAEVDNIVNTTVSAQ